MHVSHATQPRHRWTRHSQRHLTLSGPSLLHSSHGTSACRARRDKGVNSPSQSGSDSRLFHKRAKKRKTKDWAYTLSPLRLISQVRNCLLEHAKDTSTHSSKQSFPLVRCCLLENNNVSKGLSFKQSNRSPEGQSDQIDL